MAVRAPTPCRHPGCAALVDSPGYCSVHQPEQRQWDSGLRKRQRQKTRALATNSGAWRALRAQVLRGEPLCRACQQNDVITAATVVDHIDGDSHNNEWENLMPLCASCHGRLTARHDGGFGNPVRRRTDAAGD